jgi:hypothetical protein
MPAPIIKTSVSIFCLRSALFINYEI